MRFCVARDKIVYFYKLSRDVPAHINYDEAVVLSFYNSHKSSRISPQYILHLAVCIFGLPMCTDKLAAETILSQIFIQCSSWFILASGFETRRMTNVI